MPVEEIVLRVVNTIVTRACVIPIPTLVSKVLRDQSVRKVGEDVDESNRNDIDTGRITEMSQTLLAGSLSLVHHQHNTNLPAENFSYIVHSQVSLRRWVVIGGD